MSNSCSICGAGINAYPFGLGDDRCSLEHASKKTPTSRKPLTHHDLTEGYKFRPKDRVSIWNGCLAIITPPAEDGNDFNPASFARRFRVRFLLNPHGDPIMAQGHQDLTGQDVEIQDHGKQGFCVPALPGIRNHEWKGPLSEDTEEWINIPSHKNLTPQETSTFIAYLRSTGFQDVTVYGGKKCLWERFFRSRDLTAFKDNAKDKDEGENENEPVFSYLQQQEEEVFRRPFGVFRLCMNGRIKFVLKNEGSGKTSKEGGNLPKKNQ